MAIVTLVSGGLDSSLMAVMTAEQQIVQHPLFIDYGQRSAAREWSACKAVLRAHKIPPPRRLDVSAFGKLIPSGLTSRRKDLVSEAFLPGRNTLFLVIGAAYAATVGAESVAVGLLSEEHHIFADQTKEFLLTAERLLRMGTDARVRLVAPLMGFTKAQVIALAATKRITSTYSCHAGTAAPCGRCISCREFLSSRGGD
jgi:7-cyano-7-deazaguanine synthase